MWKWIIGVPAGLFVLMLIIGSNSPGASEKGQGRRAIALCWEEQAKKSLAPDVARFVAGTCEKMESDFTAKYGVKP